jgi:hypothetical protein
MRLAGGGWLPPNFQAGRATQTSLRMAMSSLSGARQFWCPPREARRPQGSGRRRAGNRETLGAGSGSRERRLAMKSLTSDAARSTIDSQMVDNRPEHQAAPLKH